MSNRLSQKELLEAVQLYLRKRGDMSQDFVRFRFKFGMVGEPTVTLVGDAIDLPDAGQVYLDWEIR